MGDPTTYNNPAFTGINQSGIFDHLAHQAHQNELAFAMWQLPGQVQKHFIADLSGKVTRTRADLDELPEGFILSPFNNPNLDKTELIRADIHYYSGEGQIRVNPLISGKERDLIQKFEAEPDQKIRGKRSSWFHSTPQNSADTTAEQYQTDVERAVACIKAGEFQKVVLSKVKNIPLSETFDPLDIFFLICRTYQNAFVSLVSIPGVGTWLGASPESLISVDATTFKTSSVAGTQRLDPEVALPDVAWTQKEIEEQAIVSRYIINCFKKIRLREFDEIGPRTVRAANLIHLRTDYLVDLTSVNFPQLGTVMLELLHPTSAVCGMPKEESLQFIGETEKFDRGFYSGFLGPVNVKGATDIFVNLRCMSLQENSALLYSGAGITGESKPEKEWLETEIKCDTLLNLINR